MKTHLLYLTVISVLLLLNFTPSCDKEPVTPDNYVYNLERNVERLNGLYKEEKEKTAELKKSVDSLEAKKTKIVVKYKTIRDIVIEQFHDTLIVELVKACDSAMVVNDSIIFTKDLIIASQDSTIVLADSMLVTKDLIIDAVKADNKVLRKKVAKGKVRERIYQIGGGIAVIIAILL
jgi:hypothetical protein